jgi:hypothetical protein
MAITEEHMNGLVQVVLIGDPITFRVDGIEHQGFAMKRHMRVIFANGDEMMTSNPLADLPEFHDPASSHGAVIVRIAQEPKPTEVTSPPDRSFLSRADIHSDQTGS